MVEQVFLSMWKVWAMHNTDIQCTVGGERRPKGREDFLFKFFLSCHRMNFMNFILQLFPWLETDFGSHGTD